MKGTNLIKLNFDGVLKYEGVDGYSTNRPYKCNGFCMDCEKKGLLENDEYLEAISHAADSDDFYRLYSKKHNNNTKILMIFENPGGNANDYLGEWIESEGVKKYVPNNIYYWLDDKVTSPPKTIEELVEINRFYGPYLAYLIEKFDLNDVYITNLTKCKLRGGDNYWKVRENCIRTIMEKELSEILPEAIFFYGMNAKNYFMTQALSKYHSIDNITLYHPSAIALSQRYDMTKEEMIRENDKRINEILERRRNLTTAST